MNYGKTGALIKTLRENKNISQKDLARKLHVTSAAVSKWENGKGFPDVSLLESLSSELDISVTELINGQLEEGSRKPEDTAIREMIDNTKGHRRKMMILNLAVLALIFLAVRNLLEPEKDIIENNHGITMTVPYTIQELSTDPESQEDIFCYYSRKIDGMPNKDKILSEARTTRIRKFVRNREEFLRKKAELKTGNFTFYYEEATEDYMLYCTDIAGKTNEYILQLQFLKRDEGLEISFKNLDPKEIIDIIQSIQTEKS